MLSITYNYLICINLHYLQLISQTDIMSVSKNNSLLDDQFFLKELMEHIPDSIFFKDKESRFTKINRACAFKFGLDNPEDAVGKTDFDFFAQEHARDAYNDEQKIIETGEPIIGKIEKEVLNDPNNTLTWSSTTKLPLYDENENLIGTFGIARDITSQKIAELKLEESEKKYRNIFENIQDVFYRTDKDGIVTDISPSIENYTNFKRSEIIGRDTSFFYKYSEEKNKLLEKLKKEGSVSDFEIRLRTKSDKVVYASANAHLLLNKNKEIIGIAGILRDITERKISEKKLKESDETLKKLSEQIPGTIYQYQQYPDGSSRFPFSSDGIRDIYEITPADVKHDATKAIKRIHPEDYELVMRSIDESFQTLENWELDYRVKLPKKGVRWLRGRARPEKLKNDSVMWHGYITDITDQKKMIEANIQLKKQFQAVLDTMPNQVFVKDINGRILMANKAAATYFGMTPKDIVGKSDEDLGVDKEQSDKFNESTRKVIETGQPHFIKEGQYVNKDGQKEWHQAIKVPFRHAGANKPAVLIVVTDITLRKKKEMELNETIGIVGDQNKRLLNFAHIVSHNLRNHAGNISMLLSLYDEEESDDDKEELLGHLKTASERLTETIQDLNEIVATQSKVDKNLKKLNIKEYLDKSKEILTTEIVAHNVKIQENVPDNLTIEYNPAYLESILLNLLSNAIKYRHPERQPVIQLEAFEKEDRVIFKISDNGVGIDLDKHGEKLFGMYNTFHGNENAKGIGLFITKNQVESMGGNIEIESEVNKGTTFKLKLS